MGDRSLLHCDPVLVGCYGIVSDAYEAMHLDRSLLVISTLRTTAEQQADYAKGRTAPGKKVTDKDGVIQKSRHQANANGQSDALDVAVVIHDGKLASHIVWDKSFYADIGHLAALNGLRWGGTWGDFGHLELVGGHA